MYAGLRFEVVVRIGGFRGVGSVVVEDAAVVAGEDDERVFG